MKSAYQLGVNLEEANKQQNSGPSSEQGKSLDKWQHIWKLQLPGKVRMFLWRLTHNILPTLLNIKRKHIELDTRCPMCQRLDEDGGHLFLKCKNVKAIWREQNLEDVRVALCECPDAFDVMRHTCSLPTERKLRAWVLLWDWWTTRNKTYAGEKQRSTGKVSAFITKHLMDFACLQTKSPPTSTVKYSWTPPAAGLIKINTDAAFHEESKAGAWGFVARDEHGTFLVAATG